MRSNRITGVVQALKHWKVDHPEVANQRFGFLLDAFGFGAPPHGGFAFGIDRLAALLCGEDTIREVIAFPKTQSGLDLMTGAPKQIARDTLQSYGLAISESPKKA